VRLEARGLTIGYGRTVVGSNIDLAISPGEIFCLLGPNGCGKTTLFRSLLGLIPTLGGEVLLGDQPIASLSRAEMARRISYVPQAHAPPFPYEAIEIVMMGRTARLGRFAQPGPADREAAHEEMRRLGIAELATRDYTRLSGGQRQLVLIARALAQRAPLIVMDEPTASLDFGNQSLVLNEIDKLAHAASHNGQGVILSTHNPDHAFALGSEVVLMHDGGIYRRGRPREVLTSESLSTVYDVPVIVERTPGGRHVCVPAGAEHAAGREPDALRPV